MGRRIQSNYKKQIQQFNNGAKPTPNKPRQMERKMVGKIYIPQSKIYIYGGLDIKQSLY